jgi:hypothetical protein
MAAFRRNQRFVCSQNNEIIRKEAVEQRVDITCSMLVWCPHGLRQTIIMSSAGFEPVIPAIKRLQTYALHRRDTGIGATYYWDCQNENEMGETFSRHTVWYAYKIIIRHTNRNRPLDIWQIILKRSLKKYNEVVDYILPAWWKGNRTVPLQPMQVVKCDQGVYPAPGSVDGPPSPGGYKYGELALQVGGWATGRQRVTLRKQDVRKHKLWPGKGQAKVKKQSWLGEVL